MERVTFEEYEAAKAAVLYGKEYEETSSMENNVIHKQYVCKGGSNLLRVVQEQQETIEKQSRLIADLIATLESWEQTAGYDGAELKERAKDLQLRERQDL